MEHINGVSKTDRVYGPLGIPAVVFDDFQNSWAFALPPFRLWMFTSKLRDANRHPNFVLHSYGRL